MRGHNEGSIRQRSDGLWEIRVTAGIDFSTGKRKRISYYAKTRAEATKLLHEKEYAIHFRDYIDPTSTTLIDWLKMWLETYMKNRRNSPPTQVMQDISTIILLLHFRKQDLKMLLRIFYRTFITTRCRMKDFHLKL